jgi:hypothetical protein
MERFTVLILLLLSLTACSSNQAFELLSDGQCSVTQKSEITSNISSQLQAFAKENWEGAYSYSSESFRQTFSVRDFTAIITDDYSVLVSNQGYSFGLCSISNREIFQAVEIDLPNSSVSIIYQLTVEKKKLGIVAARFSSPEDSLNA